MAVITLGAGNAQPKPHALVQSLALIAAICIAVVFISRVTEAGRRLMSRQQPPSAASHRSHCAEFIMLAQSRYADEWRYRLDPADTVCAQEVQKAWEAKSIQRKVKVEETLQASYSPTIPAAPSEQPADSDAARARNPETYCLNMISLASSRHGLDWKSKLSDDDVAGCKDAIASAHN